MTAPGLQAAGAPPSRPLTSAPAIGGASSSKAKVDVKVDHLKKLNAIAPSLMREIEAVPKVGVASLGTKTEHILQHIRLITRQDPAAKIVLFCTPSSPLVKEPFWLTR